MLAAARKRKARKKKACAPRAKTKGKRCAKRKAVKKPVAKRRPAAAVPLAKPPTAPPAPSPQPVPAAPAASVPSSSVPTTTTPSSGGAALSSPVARYSGPFGRAQAERLLWRAGCGPSPGHADALVAKGLEGAIASLTRPQGAATLTGAEPTVGGDPLQPRDAWGHDHLWFLDRMVRTDQPLIERMTLIWHDWFATSITGVDQRLLIDQNELFRRSALGSFSQLAADVTQDPAMLLWLNGIQNTKWNPNENYAREVMELFTLGADRGAYTETDVRQLARCLTGFTADWSAEEGTHNFRYEAARHDTTSKTVFGKSGNFTWQDGVRMCLENPKHATYFVTKLWSYFVPTAPSSSDLTALADLYESSGRQVRPIVEALLLHPDFYTGERMVKPPVIYVSGMLRQQRRPIDRPNWLWYASPSGQRLFEPPNVAGWDESRWLDTSTLRARWLLVASLLQGFELTTQEIIAYDKGETAEQALDRALAFTGDPALTDATRARLLDFARTAVASATQDWQRQQYRGVRQNAMRQLVLTSPDLQTC